MDIRKGGTAFLLTLACACPQAGEPFKCGSTFQDRPCEGGEVQRRLSRTQGAFVIEQVNPDTDHACARSAAEGMRWRDRLQAGESLEKLHGDIQALKISRHDKSLLRDALTALQGYRGTPVQVRSELESQCMATKRRTLAPVREDAPGAAYAGRGMRPDTEARLMQAEARRMQAEQRRAQAAARLEAARARLP